MLGVTYLAVVVAAVAALVSTGLWYIAFGKAMAKITGTPYAEIQKERMLWKPFVILGEYVVIASVLAYLVVRLDVTNWTGAVWYGFLVWLGFSATQWVGAMTWDKMPWKIAAIRAGDWLMKLVIIAIIVSLWH